MATTDLMVGIGAEYKGKAAFDKANKATGGLDKSVKNLAKSFAAAFSAQKAYAFGKQSVEAFLKDDAAAAQLSKTLQNLGLGFYSVDVKTFIQKLQDTTGVLDDELRPAFSSLLAATSDYAKSQTLLNTALDVSKGTGKSLSTVTAALSKAYLGNYGAVSKLGAGISKAEIAGADFNAIVDKLNKNWGGSAATAAGTYAGQIQLLKAAYSDVQEIIGEGIVDAFKTLIGPGGSATEFTNSMRDAALYVGDIIRGLGIVGSKLQPLNSFFEKFTGKGFLQSIINFNAPFLPLLDQLGKAQRQLSEGFLGASPEPAQIGYAKLEADKRAKEALIISKKILDATKKQTKIDKEKLALAKAKAVLDKAGAVMNMDLIQNTAALMGKIDDDQRTRLLLQQALILGNAEDAGVLAQKLLASQGAALQLAGINPLGQWKPGFQDAFDALEKIRLGLENLGQMKIAFPIYPGVPTGGGYSGGVGAAPGMGTPFGQVGSFVDSIGTPFGQAGGNGSGYIGTPFGQAGGNTQTIQITIDPNAAAYGINAAVVNANANGSSPTVVRNGFFNYGG